MNSALRSAEGCARWTASTRARTCSSSTRTNASIAGCASPNVAVDAIKPDTEPGLEKWLSLNAEYAKIWPNITVKKAPPPDYKEWEGKPDKDQYFSPNSGAGDLRRTAQTPPESGTRDRLN
jgi:Domain of unknown function (DUF3470)